MLVRYKVGLIRDSPYCFARIVNHLLLPCGRFEILAFVLKRREDCERIRLVAELQARLLEGVVAIRFKRRGERDTITNGLLALYCAR